MRPFLYSLFVIPALAIGLSGCKETPEEEKEETAAPEVDPKTEFVLETKSAEVQPTETEEPEVAASRSEPRPEFNREEFERRREEWRNMSEEERAEARRQRIAEIDTNGDGNISKSEAPEQMWEFISRADTNGDDMISEQERTDFRAQMEAERTLRELSGEGGDDRPGGGFRPGGFKGKGKGKGGDSN